MEMYHMQLGQILPEDRIPHLPSPLLPVRRLSVEQADHPVLFPDSRMKSSYNCEFFFSPENPSQKLPSINLDTIAT